MTAVLIRGNAQQLPLPDGSVDLIVTSPPYFNQRKYLDNGESLPGQHGNEATTAEYLASLLTATRECARVLKRTGSMFVVLGDKYSAYTGSKWGHGRNLDGRDRASTLRVPVGGPAAAPTIYGVPNKSLLGMPWRYALACIGGGSSLDDTAVIKALVRDVAAGLLPLGEAERLVDELARTPREGIGLGLRAEIIWCLSGGARVYARTPTGDRPVMLRDLVRAYRPENIKLWNGERWTQVLGWSRSPDRDGALEIELRTGERIGCTPGHRWPTQRGVIRADEIRIGDVIATARLPEPEEPRRPAGLGDDDIGWLIGLYMAEGSRSEKTIQIAGHEREVARHDRLARIARAYDGQAAVYHQASEHGVTCNLSGSVLRGIIDRYVGSGRTARSKRLRHAVWQRSNEFLAAIADGYLSGDGHYDAKNDRWRLGFTQNDEWAADLRTLAARLGVKLSLRRYDHMFDGRRYPGWRGEWRWTRSAYHTAKQDGEVIAIRASGARNFYDVGVADDPHLFALASGVLTHNSKTNGMPDSADDRVGRTHEQIFHFSRHRNYFSAVDEIREPHQPQSLARSRRRRVAPDLTQRGVGVPNTLDPGQACHPLGRVPRSVWDIPTAPLIVPEWLEHARCCGGRKRPGCTNGLDHHAAYPPALVRRIVEGWCPRGICTVCGEGRRPVTEYTGEEGRRPGGGGSYLQIREPGARDTNLADASLRVRAIIGHVCACTPYTDHPGTGENLPRKNYGDPAGLGQFAGGDLGNKPRTGPWREYHFDRWTPAPTRPAVILDPYSGTGTTVLVADVLGQTGIGIELSGDYNQLATWRVHDPGERARALEVPRPPKQAAGQEQLEFGGAA